MCLVVLKEILSILIYDYLHRLYLGNGNRTHSEFIRGRITKSEIMIETLCWHELVKLHSKRTLCVFDPYTSQAF